MIVALEGFEPSQAEPESDVLPLHHKAIGVVITTAKVRIFSLPARDKGKKIGDTAKKAVSPLVCSTPQGRRQVI